MEHETNRRRFRVHACEAQQRELLERYDVVLTTDVDEIVAPDPDLGTLGDYIEGFSDEFVNCIGYEVLHLKDAEPPAVPGPADPRAAWPLVPKPRIRQAAARHGADRLGTGVPHPNGRPAQSRSSLRLIHLHRMDYAICLARHRRG